MQITHEGHERSDWNMQQGQARVLQSAGTSSKSIHQDNTAENNPLPQSPTHELIVHPSYYT